jgi:hypothetical protein
MTIAKTGPPMKAGKRPMMTMATALFDRWRTDD